MTVQTPRSQNSRAYNFLSGGCGDRALDATAVAAIKALNESVADAADGPTTATKLNDVLDIIRAAEVRARAVDSQSIGNATSIRN